MAVSTTQIFIILVLTIILIVAVWMFVMSLQRKKFLDTYSYARGANAWKDDSTVHLSCGADRKICVFRSTQICTGTNGQNENYEDPSTDPIASGVSSIDKADVNYGEFNPTTTVDLTQKMSDNCNDKATCDYKFAVSDHPFPDGITCNQTPQLLSSYSCIPIESDCENYLGKYVPTAPAS